MTRQLTSNTMKHVIKKSEVMKPLITLSVIATAVISANAYAQTGILNLVTTESGLYRVTHEQLVAQGVDLEGVAVDQLSLSHNGEAVQRYVHDEGADNFGAGDYIDFVAEEVYNRYIDEAIYTLHIDASLVSPIRELSDLSGGNLSVGALVSQKGSVSVEKAEKNNYWIASPNLDEPFYMDFLLTSSGPVKKSFPIDLPKLSGNSNNLSVSVTVSGASSVVEAPDHHVVVRFNGQEVSSLLFDGITRHTLTGTVPASSAQATGNVVEIELPFDHGAPFENVSIESINVAYERDLLVDDNAVEFSSAAGALLVDGFTGSINAPLSVYQKSASGVVRLKNQRRDYTSRSSFQMRLTGAAGVESDYIIANDVNIASPELRNLDDLVDISSGEAEYLVIAHKDFIGSSLNELLTMRAANYSTKLVDVEQIYAQFGRHTAEAEPIHEYIQYAVANMGTKMVVLIGGDSYDYHGYQGQSVSYVPTLYRVIDGSNLVITHAPTDAAYGDIDEDGIPDIAVGRFPVRTVAELDDIVVKIQQFEQRDYAGSAVFAADKIDNGHGYSFVPDAESIVSNLPQPIQQDLSAQWQSSIGDQFDSKKAYIELDGAEVAKDKLVSAINDGVELTSYLGHSNMFKWSDSLFSTADVAALTNETKPTVMTQYGCWNTYFVMPTGNSMAHVAMLSGQNGAATVLGSSTLTLASSEAALGQHLFKEMYIEGKTIGEALIAAKQAISSNPSNGDVLLGWQIMGDPAIVMNPVN